MEESGESNSTLHPNTPGLLLQIKDFIPKLQRHELVLQFKCIEGWSQIVQWAGVRFADFMEMFPPALIDGKEPRYVYMETPDGDYYVGYDLHNLRHPQALLVTQMMGALLTQNHGSPLRLYTPTKYGYKQIKRIGLIAYTNEKPDDYWTKLGYDWYAGPVAVKLSCGMQRRTPQQITSCCQVTSRKEIYGLLTLQARAYRRRARSTFQ